MYNGCILPLLMCLYSNVGCKFSQPYYYIFLLELCNGLIRQYIPKGTDFSGITDEFVAWVEEKLNNRPRKRLGYLTPNEKFNSILTN